MTSYPTLFGTGGHKSVTSDTYDAGNTYSNVAFGRCGMSSAPVTTESYVQQTMRVPGTISYLSWRVETGFGSTLTLTLRVNSSNSALAISIPGDTTGWVTDSTDSVDVSIGDTLDFATTVGTTFSDYTGSFYCVSARFDADTASAQLVTTVGPTATVPSTVEKFINFLGILGFGGDESSQQFKSFAAGTWQNLACNVASPNQFNRATTVTSRKNGSDGEMAISISAFASGYFEDMTSNASDSVSVGDKLDYGIVASESGGTGSLTMTWIGAHFIATDAALCVVGGSTGGSAFIGGTVYTSFFGGGDIPIATGSSTMPRVTGLLPYACGASNFTNYLPDGSGGSATFTLLKNGAATSLSISTDGNSGYFTDNSVNVSFDVGDTCANEIAVTSGSVNWASASLLLTAS